MYRAPPKREDDAPPEAAEPAWLGCDYCDRWSHVACELAAAPREVDVGDGFDRIVGAADSFAEAFGAAAVGETSGSTRMRPARGTAGSHADAEDGGGEEVGSEGGSEGWSAGGSPAGGSAASRYPRYRCHECRAAASRGEPLPAPRALAAFASPTSVAAGARVAHGRVVHARPFLRGGGGGGGGSKSGDRGRSPLGGGGAASSGPGGVGRGGRFPRGGPSNARGRSSERSTGLSRSEGVFAPAPGPGSKRARSKRGDRGTRSRDAPPGVASLPNPPPSARAPEGSREPKTSDRTSRDFGTTSGDAPGLREGRGARGDRGDETERAAERRDPEATRSTPREASEASAEDPKPSARPEAFRSLPKPLHREPGGTPIAAPPAVANEACPGELGPGERGPGAAPGEGRGCHSFFTAAKLTAGLREGTWGRARGGVAGGSRGAGPAGPSPTGTPRDAFGGDVGTAGGGGTDAEAAAEAAGEAAAEEEEVLLYDADTWLTGRRTSYGV